MTENEMKRELAAIENERDEVVNKLTEDTATVIRHAFLNNKQSFEDEDFRSLANYSGLSVGTLHAWFPKDCPKTCIRRKNPPIPKEKPKTAKKTDGPRMISVIRGACLADVALPDVLDYSEDMLCHSYDEMPNAWNVFIQNMNAMKSVILRKRTEALARIGYTLSNMGESQKELIKKLTNHAGKISKYYDRIVKAEGIKEEKEDSMHIGHLSGNPNCELKTIITTTRCLNKDVKLSKWFQRWKADEIICDGQETIALYEDEKEKLSVIAPYLVGGERSVMAAIRVGSVEEMEENYSEMYFGRDSVRGIGTRFISEMRRVPIKGAVRENQIFIRNWEELYSYRCVQEGDLLVALPVKKRAFARPQIVVFNLSKMFTEEILGELKKAEEQNCYQNIWLSPIENSRSYSVRPDNESIEQFYQNDPLWLYHSEKESSQELESAKFILEPDYSYLGESGPESMEVKKLLLDAKSKYSTKERMIRYYSAYAALLHGNKDVIIPEKSDAESIQSVRTARFNSFRSELQLELPFPQEYGNERIMLERKKKVDFVYNNGQTIDTMFSSVVSWAKELVVYRLAEKAEEILRDCKDSRFDDAFIDAYKERILSYGIDELIREDRLWLEMLFPTNLDGRIQWYWHVDYRRPEE